MRQYIGALFPVAWGIASVVLDFNGVTMSNGTFYSGIIMSTMLGIMIGALLNVDN